MKKLLLISVFILGGCQTQFSDEAIIATYQGTNDFELCLAYYSKKIALASNKETRYRLYKIIINEIDRRSLDCKTFPEFLDKEKWMEEWIQEYEESLEQ